MIHSKIKYSHYSFAQSIKLHGFTRIVLTIAHLDHDHNNSTDDNLAALCQRCHLTHDRHQHANNRKYGRNWKKYQLTLF
jgi:5-methylcytosine-specific restriction endonuclease McrA